jgi:hypothetical protein
MIDYRTIQDSNFSAKFDNIAGDNTIIVRENRILKIVIAALIGISIIYLISSARSKKVKSPSKNEEKGNMK